MSENITGDNPSDMTLESYTHTDDLEKIRNISDELVMISESAFQRIAELEAGIRDHKRWVMEEYSPKEGHGYVHACDEDLWAIVEDK